jgi:hypothetical protein
MTFSAETAENHPDIEKQWAVKSFHHAETYFKLIQSIHPQNLKLTKFDNEIYDAFTTTFPEINVADLDEYNHFKVHYFIQT